MNTRKQKVELLASLLSGKKRLHDIPIARTEIWTNSNCEEGYLKNEITDMVLSREKLQERVKAKADYTIIFIEEKTYT